MSRVIKTVSADGSSSGAGLTTADVNTLIQAKSDWELVKALDITSQVAGWRITDGIDNDTYAAYKYVFTDLAPSSSAYYAFSIRNKSGSRVNFTYFSHISNTSHAYSSGTSNNIMYMYGSTQGLTSGSRMFMEIEVLNNNSIQGYFRSGMAYPAGYWQHDTKGSFTCTSDVHEFGEMELGDTYNSGKVRIYGRRKRTGE